MLDQVRHREGGGDLSDCRIHSPSMRRTERDWLASTMPQAGRKAGGGRVHWMKSVDRKTPSAAIKKDRSRDRSILAERSVAREAGRPLGHDLIVEARAGAAEISPPLTMLVLNFTCPGDLGLGEHRQCDRQNGWSRLRPLANDLDPFAVTKAAADRCPSERGLRVETAHYLVFRRLRGYNVLRRLARAFIGRLAGEADQDVRDELVH